MAGRRPAGAAGELSTSGRAVGVSHRFAAADGERVAAILGEFADVVPTEPGPCFAVLGRYTESLGQGEVVFKYEPGAEANDPQARRFPGATMATKFLTYDKAAIARPGAIVERLLGARDDAVRSLAVTDSYDLEGGEESQFEDALVAVNREFAGVLARLSAALGEPAFAGTNKDKKFPAWAGTGYRVAYWKTGKRVVYLHITHVGSVAPVELNLGVVTGPPRDWAVGT